MSCTLTEVRNFTAFIFRIIFKIFTAQNDSCLGVDVICYVDVLLFFYLIQICQAR